MAKKAIVLLSLALLTLWADTPAYSQTEVPCTQLKVTTLPARGDYGGEGPFAVTRHAIQHPDPQHRLAINPVTESKANCKSTIMIGGDQLTPFAQPWPRANPLFSSALMENQCILMSRS